MLQCDGQVLAAAGDLPGVGGQTFKVYAAQGRVSKLPTYYPWFCGRH